MTRFIQVILAVSLFLAPSLVFTQVDSARLAMASRISRMVDEEGTYAAVRYIQDTDDFSLVVERYYNLTFDLYNHQKDADAVVGVARAGIHYCLAKSREFAPRDSALSADLKRFAKIISFNLGSFTYPGWQEEGIQLEECHMEAGYSAARLHLKLCQELGDDASALANAHWLMGAHLLAASRFEEAALEFDAAISQARIAEDTEAKLLNQGYSALTGILAGKEGARERFDESLEKLRRIDAEGFTSQLEDALRYFQP